MHDHGWARWTEKTCRASSAASAFLVLVSRRYTPSLSLLRSSITATIGCGCSGASLYVTSFAMGLICCMSCWSSQYVSR
jgi:hypothetical protein